MNDKKRVLIVEDHPDILETSRKHVERAGFDVDVASKRDEAFEKIRRRAYHVAMIDVNLTDYQGGRGSADQSGIDIVRKINELGEGTRCIIVSGEKGSETPVDAHDAGIHKYIIKNRIRGPEDYVGTIETLAKSCEIHAYGRFKDLIAYLSFPEIRWAWEDKVRHTLKCDAASLNQILAEVFSSFIPVLPQKDSSCSLAGNAENNQVTGVFWSRALALAIWVSIGRKGVALLEPKTTGTVKPIAARSKGPINFAVWGLPDLSRNQFLNNTNDVG